MNKFSIALVALFLSQPAVGAEETLIPYGDDNVPQNVVDLWSDVDPQKDALETEVLKEWIEDGVVCRYVIFKVGTFKGQDARIAAFYTFPEGAENAPAIVWAHGGGQRAELEHGKYVAKQGYAMVDINWGGREILEGVEKNTDWGAVDPSQGPRFYPGAKRKGTKLNLLPDEFTIDPVVSPRNGNWFLLAYAGRRAITFLEQQAEVDSEKIGFTGYSMGGNITSYVSIDPRLKAVVPMVGGAGFITADSPGILDSGMARAYSDHVELFANTMESQSYYPHTQCPVLLLSASDDFHSRFEFIYQCMDKLPHNNWRVSQNMHFSHSLGPEQWILMNLWFDKYLKGEAIEIPKTPESNLEVDAKKGTADFTVTPDRVAELTAVDIYYSHDPNPKSRFWIHVEGERSQDAWTATLPVRENLPLFVFADCSYSLEGPAEAFQGTADSFTITSNEEVYLPETIEADRLPEEAIPESVFSDFSVDGFRDWGFGSRGGMTTYKFRDPRAQLPEANAALQVTVSVPRERLSFRFRITKNKYITGVREAQSSYSFTKNYTEAIESDVIEIKASDFKDGDQNTMTDWSNISTLTFGIYDGAAKTTLHFTDEANRDILRKMIWKRED